MRKNTPAKSHPLLQGKETLPFEEDGVLLEEISLLTEEQMATKFMSKWLELMRPFSKYSRYFSESEKSKERILKEVKNNYLKYVVRGDWPERKYVIIVDSILINRFSLTPKTFEGREKLFNEERLEAQLLEKRVSRRSKRL